jgi:GxxExxY protein
VPSKFIATSAPVSANLYESALCVELEHHGLKFQCQLALPIKYRERLIGELMLDIVVQNSVILELKSVERLDPLFESQLLTYLRLSGIKTGLLINFNSRLLHQGIKRFVV